MREARKDIYKPTINNMINIQLLIIISLPKSIVFIIINMMKLIDDNTSNKLARNLEILIAR